MASNVASVTGVIENVWPDWKVDKILGEGSYGIVCKAVREEHGLTTNAAIKVISIPQNDSELSSLRVEGMDEASSRSYFKEAAEDFINEIKMLQALKGAPNIVGVEDYAIEEKPGGVGINICIRMELLKSFNDYLQGRTLSEKDVIQFGIDILKALELCAQKKIIHRDVKPENIFVSEFGDFKLGDFGIAREMEKASLNMTRVGTLNYMAPEVSSSGAYDYSVDTYSLGIVLYRLLNNYKLPFLDPNSKSISYQEQKRAVERRLNGEPLPPPLNASPAMAQVILKACAYNPAERYRTPGAFKHALEAVQAHEVPFVPVLTAEDDSGTIKTRSPGDTIEEILFCSGCGNKRTPGTRFCTKCGKEFTPIATVAATLPTEPPRPPAQPMPPIPPVTPIPTFPPTPPQPQKPTLKEFLATKAGRMALMAASVVCVVVVGIFSGIGIYNLISDDDSGGAAEHQVMNFTGVALDENWSEEYDYLDFEFVPEHSEHPTGMVFYQSIVEGETVSDGTQITLKYSIGPEYIQMPDYNRFHSESLQNHLINLGVTPENIVMVDQDSEQFSEGMVIGCNFGPGDTVPFGEQITITRSTVSVGDSSANADVVTAISTILPRYYNNYLTGINAQDSSHLSDVTSNQFNYLERRIFEPMHKDYLFSYDSIILDLDSINVYTENNQTRAKFVASFHFTQAERDGGETKQNHNTQQVEMVYGGSTWLVDSSAINNELHVGANQKTLFL